MNWPVRNQKPKVIKLFSAVCDLDRYATEMEMLATCLQSIDEQAQLLNELGGSPSEYEQLRIRHASVLRKLRHVEIMISLASQRLSEAKAPVNTTTPQLGERLLLLVLTKEERVNIPGDLAEEYVEIAEKHGKRFAKMWYYKQVAASAWPLIRKALRWGMLASIAEWIRRAV
jgi:hypothetical protein